MRISNKIAQWLSIFFAAVGGAMSLGSSLITLIPKWMLTDKQTQFLGLALFVASVIVFMFANLLEGLLKEATEPRFSLGLLRTQYKPVYPMVKLLTGEKIVDPVKVGEFYFAYLDINNEPKNRAKGQTAEKVRAQITFKLENGQNVSIDYGRWCDKDMPLLDPDGGIKSLKNVDIDPGNPETLVLAFRKKTEKGIYAFYFTDHRELSSKEKINALYQERYIGEPPVKLQLKLDGKFEPKTFDLILSINEKGEFVIDSKR